MMIMEAFLSEQKMLAACLHVIDTCLEWSCGYYVNPRSLQQRQKKRRPRGPLG